MSYYADDWLTVHLGDCLEVMAGMEAEYVAIAEARLNGTQRGLGLGA